jgi:hypothetical protein
LGMWNITPKKRLVKIHCNNNTLVVSPSPFDTTWIVLMYNRHGPDWDHSIPSHLNSNPSQRALCGKQSLLLLLFIIIFQKNCQHQVQCDHSSYPPNQMLTAVHLNLGNGFFIIIIMKACNNLSRGVSGSSH